MQRYRIAPNEWAHTAVAATAAAIIGLAALIHPTPAAAADSKELLNVSYDPTRELWRALNDAFIPQYAKDTGVALRSTSLTAARARRPAP